MRSIKRIQKSAQVIADEINAIESDKDMLMSEMEEIQNDRTERLNWIRRSLEAIRFGIIADNRGEPLYSDEELRRTSFVHFLHRYREWSS